MSRHKIVKTIRSPYPELKCLFCNQPVPYRKGAKKFAITDQQRYGKNRKFCSKECREAYYKAKYREANPEPEIKLATGTTGTIAELRVAVDLLSRGFAVFRAMSPHCSCDLAVLDDKKLLRVEVTSGKRLGNGKISHPKKQEDSHKWDVLAVVLPDSIDYTPDFPS